MSNKKTAYLGTSIGKKQLMGLTGIGLALFVLTHMSANMLILFSPEAYNKYSHALITNPFIYIAELGLVGMVVAHMISAVILRIRNKSARTQNYANSLSGEKAVDYASRTMIHSGAIIFIFLALHLVTFKFGTFYSISYDGVEMRDLHRLVIEVFQSPYYVIWYLFSLVLLFSHLAHGVASSIKTLGFNHPKYNGPIECIGKVYAILVTLGFFSQPLYVFFFHS